MLVQFLADLERMVKFAHELLFLVCQFAWMGWVDSGETVACHLVFLTVNGAYATHIVNIVKHAAVEHVPFRAAFEYLCLLLKLYYTYCLVHLCSQL